MIQVLADEHPTARKAHRCELCARTIQPGERYNRQRCIGDDGPYVWKQCEHCDALMCLLPIDWRDYDDGFGVDSLRDWEAGTVAELRLLVLWRKRWTRRDGSLHPVPDQHPEETDRG